MKYNRRVENKPFNGSDKRSHVRKNYQQTAQLYQMDEAVRVLFNPDFNVWQVHKMNYPSYQQVRWEIVGYHNSNVAFEFAVLYVKLLKYGLDEEEMAKLDRLGYEPIEREMELKNNSNNDIYNKGEQE